MRRTLPPRPVKLFVGMLSSDTALFDACKDLLHEKYGPVDHRSEIVPWDFTDHYLAEMGPGLLRTFIFFKKLTDPGELAGMKTLTNRIEEQMAVTADTGILRKINLDPGYITEAKVVLATTKDYSHRIYIGGNIFAEIALVQKGGRYTPLAHTYPDYRTDEYICMFGKARELLRESLREKGL
jgi:hypothetical protein